MEHSSTNTPSAAITYSRGRHKGDNLPQQRSAADFDAFIIEALLGDRANTKGKQYLCAAMRRGKSPNQRGKGDAHWRCADLAEPRAWLPFDLDRIDGADAYAAILEFLAPYRGAAYTTHSHTAQAPRCRFVLALSRPVDRAEGDAVGRSFQARIEAALGAERFKFDGSVYRAEQPIFCPPTECEVQRFAGAPLDVDELLQDVPLIERKPGRSAKLAEAYESDPVVRRLQETGAIIEQRQDGGFNIVCPRSEHHSTETGPSSTAYWPPHTGGYPDGHFKCLHTGCAEAAKADFIEALGLAPDSADADFGIIADWDAIETPARRRLFFELYDDIRPDLNVPWLVRGLLERNTVSVLYGDSNTGKSFWALDVAMHVAAKTDWNGKRVERCAVVYVAAEAGRGMRRRVEAFKQRHGLAHVPFALIPCPVDLLRPGGDVTELLDLIHEAGRQMGMPVGLIVLDTLARAIAGGNESSAEDMGAFMRNIERIRAGANAHVMIVHHSGKDATKGARGWSGLRAGVDTEIEITAAAGQHVATVRKQREEERGGQFGFALEVVTLGADAHGDAVTSCVVAPRDLSAERDFTPKTETGRIVLKAAEELSALYGDPVALDELIGRATRRLPRGKAQKDQRRVQARRSVEKLAADGFLTVAGDDVRLILFPGVMG
jgi:hypothetical protein